MRLKVNKIGQWLIYQPDQYNFEPGQIVEIHDSKPIHVLRDHHRSLVAKINFNQTEFVVKTPHNKNRSYWIRLTTLYRDSEALRDLKAQLLLDSMDIPTVSPVAALERRRLGVVTNSSIVYQFKAGDEISVKHYPQMIKIMHTLHQHGYLHDDPHCKNFLQNSDQVFVIDCKPRKNLFGQLGCALNFITLARRSEQTDTVYTLLGKSPNNNAMYKFADRLLNVQQLQRALKNNLRRILGIEHKRNKSIER